MSEDFKPTGFAPSQLAGSTTSAPKPGVIQLAFKEKGALYAAYISAFIDGGLFLPTQRNDYRLGDDVYLLLGLPDDPGRHPVAGKVCWITPPNASTGRTQGIGVKFTADDKHRQIKHKIEEILGTSISSSKPTQTICASSIRTATSASRN